MGTAPGVSCLVDEAGAAEIDDAQALLAVLDKLERAYGAVHDAAADAGAVVQLL